MASSDGKRQFSYYRRSAEEVSRRAAQTSARYDSYIAADVNWFRPKEGENCIRLMPWIHGSDPKHKEYTKLWKEHWGIDLLVHYNVGPNNGTYLCLDKMKGEPCPMCEAWRNEDAPDLSPSDRVLCWLIDRREEKAGPKLWSMPMSLSRDISAVSQVRGARDNAGALLFIDDWDEGYDVFFDREGEKKKTSYKRIEPARESSPLHADEELQYRWLTYVFDHRLPDMLKYYDYEYLQKVLSGQVEVEAKAAGRSGHEPEPESPKEPPEDGRARRARRTPDAAEEPRYNRSFSRGEVSEPEERTHSSPRERLRGNTGDAEPNRPDDPAIRSRRASSDSGDESPRAEKDNPPWEGDKPIDSTRSRLRNLGRQQR